MFLRRNDKINIFVVGWFRRRCRWRRWRRWWWWCLSIRRWCNGQVGQPIGNGADRFCKTLVWNLDVGIAISSDDSRSIESDGYFWTISSGWMRIIQAWMNRRTKSTRRRWHIALLLFRWEEWKCDSDLMGPYRHKRYRLLELLGLVLWYNIL